MNKILDEKLKKLPINPGVYFHKDEVGEIIYVGKAAVLKNRVRSYFQNSKNHDTKTRALVAEIHDTDWIETDSEIDALFLEAEMVKRYMPKYNILLRDDKSLTYIRIDMRNDWPYISFTRNPLDDDAEYYGPYYNSFPVKKALRYLRKIFPYYTKPHSEKMELDDHLGLTPFGMTSVEYKNNLRKLIKYIKGEKNTIAGDLENQMKRAAKMHDFERAADFRNKLNDFKELKRRIMFGDKEFLDISKDHALNDLSDILNLDKNPTRIEGFDISHLSGTNVVSSMVVFKNGASDRNEYRKFKIKIDKNDDFYNMAETLSRRFSEKNIKQWGMPDLVLIDGGKGQLDAAMAVRDKLNIHIPFIGLAKKQEQIIVRDSEINKSKIAEINGFVEANEKFYVINLPINSHVIKLLQRVRDESHRFAISYQSTLRNAKQTSSLLDEIPGIGPKTRSKLIKKFGSVKKISEATEAEIASVVGKAKSKLVKKYTKAL